jgi:hypothetical protein
MLVALEEKGEPKKPVKPPVIGSRLGRKRTTG